MKVRNKLTNEEMSHVDFVKYVLEETERQYSDSHDEYDDAWNALSFNERLEIYVAQYEFQLESRDWELIISQ